MDQVFSGFADFLSHSEALSGSLAAAYSGPLDAFCEALASAGSQSSLPAQQAGQVLEGLLAVQVIARRAGSPDLPSGDGPWAYTLQPFPLGTVIFSLKRMLPDPVVLYTQLNRERLFHGLITLSRASAAAQPELSFDLEQRRDGWYLRRWELDRQVPIHMEIPPGSAIPWTSSGSVDVDKILPPSLSPGFGTRLQAISSALAKPEVLTSLPDSNQTIVSLPDGDRTMQARSVARKPELRLVDESSGRVIPLKGRMTIGRGENSDLRLEDRQMSRSHCVIEPVSGGWQVQDLNSTNGTFINDKRVVGTALVKEGDRLRVGDICLRLESKA